LSPLAAAHGRRRWLSGVLLSSALLGCKSDAERAHQGQVARIAEHIDRLRGADNQAKRQPLQALAALPCPDAESCALQDLCLRAYRLHQAALDAIAELRRLSELDTAASAGLSQRIERAERDLGQAQALSEQCAAEQVRVVRRALVGGPR
jgi:hypothetical protein